MIPTNDPTTWIEEQREGYVRYLNTETGERHEVLGVCDRRGDCLIGAVIDTPDGPVEVRDHAHIAELQILLGRDRVDSELDVSVGPSFTGCCPLQIVVL